MGEFYLQAFYHFLEQMFVIINISCSTKPVSQVSPFQAFATTTEC